jgi:hypothetical protein
MPNGNMNKTFAKALDNCPHLANVCGLSQNAYFATDRQTTSGAYPQKHKNCTKTVA